MEDKIDNIKIIFFNPEIDNNIRIQFINSLRHELKRRDIKSYFNNFYDNEIDIDIVYKEDLDTYIKKKCPNVYINGVPEWIIGHTDENGIKLVISKTVEYTAQVAIHEIVHYLTYINRKNNGHKILDEGIASYIAGQISKSRKQSLQEDKPSFKNICYYINLDNNSAQFGENKGYIYGYYLARYIVTTYSKEKLVEYVLNTKLFDSELDLLEEGYNKYLQDVTNNN